MAGYTLANTSLIASVSLFLRVGYPAWVSMSPDRTPSDPKNRNLNPKNWRTENRLRILARAAQVNRRLRDSFQAEKSHGPAARWRVLGATSLFKFLPAGVQALDGSLGFFECLASVSQGNVAGPGPGRIARPYSSGLASTMARDIVKKSQTNGRPLGALVAQA